MEQSDINWMKAMYSLDHPQGTRSRYGHIIRIIFTIFLIGVVAYIFLTAYRLLTPLISQDQLGKTRRQEPASQPNADLIALLNGTANAPLTGPDSSPSFEPAQTATPTPPLPTVTYTLYYYEITSEIDEAAQPMIISSEKKDAVDHILRNMKVSSSFISDTAIVFIDERLMEKAHRFTIERKGKKMALPAIQMTDKAGVDYRNKIVLLDRQLVGGELESSFTHALGHLVFYLISAQEFREYMQLRAVKAQMIDDWERYIHTQYAPSSLPRHYDIWTTSPLEDFAESFTLMFATNAPGGDWIIETDYGMIDRPVEEWFLTVVVPIIRH